MRKPIFLFTLLLSFYFSNSQTFTGSGGVIPSDGTTAYFEVETNSLAGSILSDYFGVLSVCINLNHPNVSDIEVALISPDETRVMLTYANGGDGDNYSNTCFNDRAETSVQEGWSPFTGSFRPDEMLGFVNNGQSGYGTWILRIRDMKPGDNYGMLVGWNITFGNGATAPVDFTSSNLAIILIDTDGQQIPDDPKIPAEMQILNNTLGLRNYLTDPPQYSGLIGIEVRGSSSQMFPKKSYGLETWVTNGVSIDTSLMGMPSESDWILNANYTDKSFLRNVMAYQSWENQVHYATRYQFCELMLNGQYKGIYIFSEKIKRDKDRVDIAKLSPDQNTGDVLTGGYIFKVDKQTGSGGSGWTSTYPPSANPYGQTIFFQYEYPNEEDITAQQRNYIKNYVNSWETAMKSSNFGDTINGWRKYAIENTFIDYFFINEISKNVDGYRLSTFLHKERDSKGGKIRMGPVWDYDIAWHNANYCGGDVTEGWAYQFPCPDDTWQVPFWWSRLLQDPLYRNRLKCRWLAMRQNSLSDAWFDNYIDSISGNLMEAQERNFTTWPILGIYVWPNPWPYATTYEGEVNGLKSWVHNRLAWLDANMPGTCDPTYNVDYSLANLEFSIYPNPVAGMLNIEYQIFSKCDLAIKIISQQGTVLSEKTLQNQVAGTWSETMDVTDYKPGIYLLQINIEGKSFIKRFVKI